MAFARWTFPYVFSEEDKKAREEEKKERERKKKEGIDEKWPKGANLEVCDLKFGPIDSCREKTVNEEETYGKFNVLLTPPPH